jgi:hypothetical protein
MIRVEIELLSTICAIVLLLQATLCGGKKKKVKNARKSTRHSKNYHRKIENCYSKPSLPFTDS